MENNQNIETRDTSPLSVGNFLVIMLLMIIPIVNIILLFVWAFSNNTNLNKSNFAKAQLIMFAIIIGIYILLAIIGIGFLDSPY